MPASVHQKKGNLKGLLFVIGIGLIIGGIWYSQQLVNILEIKTTEYVKFRLKVFEANINDPNSNTDQSFLFNEVIQGNDNPIIYTDNNFNPVFWINISDELDKKSATTVSKRDSLYLVKKLNQMRQENDPIAIRAGNLVLGYYFYGYSPVIYKLRIFPYAAIGSAALFILIGYVGFSYIKKSEQQFIWVGMAKETAHQLGTPLSSISGWLELIKIKPEIMDNAVTEIENDLNRLNKIANRFSKIGSVPELKLSSLSQIIQSVTSYFIRRLPNMQKRITIQTNIKDDIKLRLNPELFEWVLENLVKNAIDAIGNKNGKISISLYTNSDKTEAYLDIYDNGKGLSQKEKTNIFKPGYSTKKRGWGLGLSLARRIIEEYHGGKLFLKESRPGEGTTFKIVLKV